MHGDEVYGIELYHRFISRFSHLANYVQLIIGNEKAYEQKIRYIEADMNRQYGVKNNSYEATEIARVNKLISTFNPDYIIDIHTTKRSSGVFFISDTVNDVRQQIYNMLDVDICIMQEKVIKNSLIGNYTNAVSLEYSLTSISEDTTIEFIEALAMLIKNTPSTINNRLYYTTRLIAKEEWKKYRNLKSYDQKPEGMALMVPKDESEMDAEYFGFWCQAKVSI